MTTTTRSPTKITKLRQHDLLCLDVGSGRIICLDCASREAKAPPWCRICGHAPGTGSDGRPNTIWMGGGYVVDILFFDSHDPEHGLLCPNCGPTYQPSRPGR